jgi:hypothetical protein
MLRLRFCALFLAFLGDCKCNSGDRAKGELASQFQQRFADALAARAAECSRSDRDAVLTMMPIHPVKRLSVGPSAAQGRVIYDASKVDACLQLVRRAPCEQVASFFDERPLGTVCGEVLAGQGIPGSACYGEIECATNAFCDATELKCPGACKAFAVIGAACGDDDRCVPGGDCRCADAACAQKICKARAKPGERCETREAPACAVGEYCIPNGAKGAGHCGVQDLTDPCPSADACALPARCIGLQDSEHPGRCSLPKKVGEPCTDGAHECADFSSCVGGICKAWNKVGGACGGMTEAKETLRCIGGWCDLAAGSQLGVCRAFRKGEEGCVGDVFLDFECGAGRCDRLMHKCISSCAPQE